MATQSYLQQVKNAVDALSPGETITAKSRMAVTWFRSIITRSMTLLKMESRPRSDLIKNAYAKEDGFTFMRKKGESEEACFYNDFEVIGKGEVL